MLARILDFEGHSGMSGSHPGLVTEAAAVDALVAIVRRDLAGADGRVAGEALRAGETTLALVGAWRLLVGEHLAQTGWTAGWREPPRLG